MTRTHLSGPPDHQIPHGDNPDALAVDLEPPLPRQDDKPPKDKTSDNEVNEEEANKDENPKDDDTTDGATDDKNKAREEENKEEEKDPKGQEEEPAKPTQPLETLYSTKSTHP